MHPTHNAFKDAAIGGKERPYPVALLKGRV